jgi:tetratricopeptide (TPR) repeat protein
MGRNREAIDHYKQALEIAREVGVRADQGVWLGNLGWVYSNMGQYQEAIDHLEQALEITREIGDRASESAWLANLGEAYTNLNQIVRAKECRERALSIARQIGDRRVEAHSLRFLGWLFVSQSEWNKAKEHLESAIQVADEIGEQQAQREVQMTLAQGYLYSGDLSSAHTAIDDARRYESQGYNYELLALRGVVALRTGDLAAAQEAFQAAVAQAEAQLSYSEQVYKALDAKGLSLCGLALALGDDDFISAAMEAYRKAREITKDAGVVTDVLRLFDALKPADSAGVLAEVRAVAEGTEVSSI